MALPARRLVHGPRPERHFFMCTWVGNRTATCRGLCPIVDGIGSCGRVAPHATLSGIQAAILESRARGGI